jgi:NAD(P)H-flavin reductase
MSTASSAEPGEPLLPEPFVVRRVARETGDVVSLEIEPGEGARPCRPLPGQFNMLYVFGVGEAPISVAGVGEGGRVLHTVRDVGAVTRALCSLAPGDAVGVRGPFGSHWPIADQRGRDVVIAAGGIGIAPLRPVVEQVMAERDSYDDVVVLYGARGSGDLLYPREYDTWREAGIQVQVTVDHADHGWDGHVGVVTTLIRHARFQPRDTVAFLCGPEVMMHFTARELIQREAAPERVFLSMERNMQCAVGFCGHCQLGPEFICLDGPVFDWPRIGALMAVREL